MYYLEIALLLPTLVVGGIINSISKEVKAEINANKSKSLTAPDTDIIQAHGARESADFFSNVEPHSFSSRTFDPHEYDSLFETFPNLPYFPDFGEIFRIQKSTTPKPSFRFPDFVRTSFSDKPVKHGELDESVSSLAGGRRPARRPPRPAPSGTKTKIAKQNQSENKEKIKPGKMKLTSKAKDYPKIFRFTSDRVNLADFDMRKKVNGNYETLAKGDDLDSNKIQRNNFLILHGGVFEIDRTIGNGLFVAGSNILPVTEVTDSDLQR